MVSLVESCSTAVRSEEFPGEKVLSCPLVTVAYWGSVRDVRLKEGRTAIANFDVEKTKQETGEAVLRPLEVSSWSTMQIVQTKEKKREERRKVQDRKT